MDPKKNNIQCRGKKGRSEDYCVSFLSEGDKMENGKTKVLDISKCAPSFATHSALESHTSF